MTHFDNAELRKRLHEQLVATEPNHGIPRGPADDLAVEAYFNRLEPGEPVFGTDDATDFVGFVVVGCVKVCLLDPDVDPLTLLFQGPGQFLLTGRLVEGARRRRTFSAVAHGPERAVVALWGPDTITRLLGALLGDRSARVMACALSSVMAIASQRLIMLPLPAINRLLFALKSLGRNFGERHPVSGGSEFEVRLLIHLTHEDLGSFIGVERETVTKAFGRLMNAGFVHVERGCIVITAAGLAAPLNFRLP